MYYRILGPPMPHSSPHYRGTYRCGPAYNEGLPETAPINRAWREYVSENLERLDDREIAQRIAAAFEEFNQSFDVVQLDTVTVAPPSVRRDELLGFDISQLGWYSLLSWGLRWGGEVPVGPPPLGPLLTLVEAH